MTNTLPIPSLEFGALQKALRRALSSRGMTWEKFEIGTQLAKLEVSAQLEGFLDAFVTAYPRLRDGLERFEATRAWVTKLVLAMLLALHSETDPEPRADWEARPFSVRESSNSENVLLVARALDFDWFTGLNPALIRLRSCVVWARFLS
jgi:nitroreductase